MPDLFAITAVDHNGRRWFAVHESLFGGWCAMTREDIVLRGERDDLHTLERAEALLDRVSRNLPAFSWNVVRFD
jgi:hypothetical protein